MPVEKKQALLPQEEETKLELQIVDAQYEFIGLMNPNAQEFKSSPLVPTVPLAHPESTDPTLPGGIMDNMALTIKQGFCVAEKRIACVRWRSTRLLQLYQIL